MREILFRGQTYEGNWRQGLLVKLNDEEYGDRWAIIPHGVESYRFNMSGDYVNPCTVGQYTGSTDKNGTKVFEGDVVDFYFFDKGSKNTKTMLIEWRDDGFWMRELFRDYRLADDFSIIKEKIFTYRGDIRHGVYTSNNTYFIEVIGNIHDNPELVKGAVDNILKCINDNEDLRRIECMRFDDLGYRKQSEGEWHTVVDNKNDIVTECSACKKQFWFMKKGQLNIDRMPFCPNCGAKMKGGAE